MSDEPVKFHSVRKVGDTKLYLDTFGQWTNNFLGAMVLVGSQADTFEVPADGVLFPFVPGDIEDGGTTFSTIEIPVSRLIPTAEATGRPNRQQRRRAGAERRRQRKGLGEG